MLNILRYILILKLISFCSGVEDVDSACTTEFCELQRQEGECVDQVVAGCRENGIMLPSVTPCNCCEYCLSYIDEDGPCYTGSPGQSTVGRICGPGLTCEEGFCHKMTNSTCIIAQEEYDKLAGGSLGEISWRPVCDAEGKFGPVYCIPSSICYCTEPNEGSRIFGEALFTSDNDEELHCSCSLAAWRAKSYLGLDTDFFRCLPNGQYDPLQCINDECFCVDEHSGLPVDAERVHVTGLKNSSLSCFNDTLHPQGRFEKSCELEHKLLVFDITYWKINGIELLYSDLPSCTEDGNYHRVQLRKKGKGFRCVDPDGNLIEPFEQESGTSDCKCARTQWLIKTAGQTELPKCNNDGTFKAWQCWRDKCYCVNCDGKQISEHKSYSEVNQLPCFTKTTCSDDINYFL